MLFVVVSWICAKRKNFQQFNVKSEIKLQNIKECYMNKEKFVELLWFYLVIEGMKLLENEEEKRKCNFSLFFFGENAHDIFGEVC